MSGHVQRSDYDEPDDPSQGFESSPSPPSVPFHPGAAPSGLPPSALESAGDDVEEQEEEQFELQHGLDDEEEDNEDVDAPLSPDEGDEEEDEDDEAEARLRSLAAQSLARIPSYPKPNYATATTAALQQDAEEAKDSSFNSSLSESSNVEQQEAVSASASAAVPARASPKAAISAARSQPLPSSSKVTIEDGSLHSRDSSWAIKSTPSPLAAGGGSATAPPAASSSYPAVIRSANTSQKGSAASSRTHSTAPSVQLIPSALEVVEAASRDRSRSHTPSPSKHSETSSQQSQQQQLPSQHSSPSSTGSPMLPSPSPDSKSRMLQQQQQLDDDEGDEEEDEEDIMMQNRFGQPHTHDFTSTNSYSDTLAYGAAGVNRSSATKQSLKGASLHAVAPTPDDEDYKLHASGSYEMVTADTPSRQPGMQESGAGGHRRGHRYETNASLALSEDSWAGGQESSASPIPSPIHIRGAAAGLIQNALAATGMSTSSWQNIGAGGSPASHKSGSSESSSLVPSSAFPATISSSSASALTEKSIEARGVAIRANLAQSSVAPYIADRLTELLLEKEEEIFRLGQHMRAMALKNSQRNHEMLQLMYHIERSKVEYNRMLEDVMKLSGGQLKNVPEVARISSSPKSASSPHRIKPFHVVDPSSVMTQAQFDRYLSEIKNNWEQQTSGQNTPRKGLPPASTQPLPLLHSEETLRAEKAALASGSKRSSMASSLSGSAQNSYRDVRSSPRKPQSIQGTFDSATSTPRAPPTQQQQFSSASPRSSPPRSTPSSTRDRAPAAVSSAAAAAREDQESVITQEEESTQSSFESTSLDSYAPSRIHSARELDASGNALRTGSAVFAAHSKTPSIVPPLSIPVVSLPVSAPVTSRDGAPEEPPRSTRKNQPQETNAEEGGQLSSRRASNRSFEAESKQLGITWPVDLPISPSATGPAATAAAKSQQGLNSSVVEPWDTTIAHNLSMEGKPRERVGEVTMEDESPDHSSLDEDETRDDHTPEETSPSSITDEFIRAEHHRQASEELAKAKNDKHSRSSSARVVRVDDSFATSPANATAPPTWLNSGSTTASAAASTTTSYSHHHARAPTNSSLGLPPHEETILSPDGGRDDSDESEDEQLSVTGQEQYDQVLQELNQVKNQPTSTSASKTQSPAPSAAAQSQSRIHARAQSSSIPAVRTHHSMPSTSSLPDHQSFSASSTVHRQKAAHVAESHARQSVWAPESLSNSNYEAARKRLEEHTATLEHDMKEQEEEDEAFKRQYLSQQKHKPKQASSASVSSKPRSHQPSTASLAGYPPVPETSSSEELSSTATSAASSGVSTPSQQPAAAAPAATASSTSGSKHRAHPSSIGSGVSFSTITSASSYPANASEATRLLTELDASRREAARYKDLVVRLKQDRVKLKDKVERLKRRLLDAQLALAQGQASRGGRVAATPAPGSNGAASEFDSPISAISSVAPSVAPSAARPSSVDAAIAGQVDAAVSASAVERQNALIQKLLQDMAQMQQAFKSESKSWRKQRKALESEVARLTAGQQQQQQQQEEQDAAIPASEDGQMDVADLRSSPSGLDNSLAPGALGASSRGRRRSRSPLVHILPNDNYDAGNVSPSVSASARAILHGQHALSHQHAERMQQEKLKVHSPPRSTSQPRTSPTRSRARSLSAQRYPHAQAKISIDQLNPHLMKPTQELEAEADEKHQEYMKREADRQTKLNEKRDKVKFELRERAKLLAAQKQQREAERRRDAHKLDEETKEELYASASALNGSHVEGFQRAPQATITPAAASSSSAHGASHRRPLANWNVREEVAWQEYRGSQARMEAEARNHFAPLGSSSRGLLEPQVREATVSPSRSQHRFIREERREQERKRLEALGWFGSNA